MKPQQFIEGLDEAQIVAAIAKAERKTSGEIRVYVGAEDERRAQELLKQREAEYERLDDDEETLVTDEGPAVVDESTEVDESATAEGDDGARS